MDIISLILPEICLAVFASALFLMGTIPGAATRRATPWVALLGMLLAFAICYLTAPAGPLIDHTGAIRLSQFAVYIKLLSLAVAILFVLLSWPVNRNATGNSALDFGSEAGEYFALMLLSVVGLLLVASANDIILLFLGIELASIPTYIMVSVSRPLPSAQEAGVKYFFLGAMAAALMLFGLSYLYGTTGLTRLDRIADLFAPHAGNPTPLSPWQMLAALMLIGGFCFKMAAVPLHSYVADVYQGAATPVTAMLSFVPKASGFAALIKLLYALGGGSAAMSTGHGTIVLPSQIITLIWVLAVLTMTVGNVLGLWQNNVKRLLAYSSVAHTGYMLVGIAAMLAATRDATIQSDALVGVLFYLGAYGIMNTAAFGVLMLLPARPRLIASPTDAMPVETIPAAETFDDLAGSGREHPALGLAMAIGVFSLIGIPMTVGFWGKFYLIRPALHGANRWLVILTMLNAAISAAYYLRILAAMFLQSAPAAPGQERDPAHADGGTFITELPAPRSLPALAAVILSCAGAVIFGTFTSATDALANAAAQARLDPAPPPGNTGPSAPSPEDRFTNPMQGSISTEDSPR